MKFTEYIQDINKNLIDTRCIYKKQSYSIDESIQLCINKLKQIQDTKNCVFLFGNGASSSIADHMSTDMLKNASLKTEVCNDNTYLTAIGNDIHFNEIFAFFLKRKATNKDLVITISSSGQSPNIINAIKYAKENNIFTVGFSGLQETNYLHQTSDLSFYVPTNTYGLTESAHAILLHCILDEFLDKYMGGRI